MGVHLGTRKPARLYHKESGIFFIRVLLAKPEKSKNPRELRRSLQTKDLGTARTISHHVNALLERVSVQHRESVVNQFFEHGISTYSVPGILNISGEDDHRRFMELLTRFPAMEQAFATRIASAMVPTPVTIPAAAPTAMTHYPPQADVAQSQLTDHQRHRPDALSTQRFQRERPKHPLTLNQGIEKYLHFYNRETKTQNSRTGRDKLCLYVMLQEFLVKTYPQLGADPWAYDIDSSMVSAFLQEQGERPAKGSPALAANRREKSGGGKRAATPGRPAARRRRGPCR